MANGDPKSTTESQNNTTKESSTTSNERNRTTDTWVYSNIELLRSINKNISSINKKTKIQDLPKKVNIPIPYREPFNVKFKLDLSPTEKSIFKTPIPPKLTLPRSIPLPKINLPEVKQKTYLQAASPTTTTSTKPPPKPKGLTGAVSRLESAIDKLWQAVKGIGASAGTAVGGAIGTYMALGPITKSISNRIGNVYANLKAELGKIMNADSALQALIGTNLRKDFIEGIEGTIEGLKDEFSVGDKSFIGKSLREVKLLTKEVYGDFGDMRSDAFALYETYDKFLESLTNNIKSLGVMGELYSIQLTKSKNHAFLFEKYRRALGLADEDVEVIAMNASVRNRSIYKTFEEIAKETAAAAKLFGVNKKIISRDTNDLRRDFETFGHLSEKQLINLSAKMRSMQVDVKDLKGVMNFNTFSEAAQAASSLSQAFGMNIDALKLLKSQDPGEIAEMFAKSFARTGRTYDSLTRRQKKFLSDQTRLPAKVLRAMMNNRLSLKEAQKKIKQDLDQETGIDSETNIKKQMENLVSQLGFKSEIKVTKRIKELTSTNQLIAEVTANVAKQNKNLKESLLGLGEAKEKLYNTLVGEGVDGKGVFNQFIQEKMNEFKSQTHHAVKSINKTFNNKNVLKAIASGVAAVGGASATYNTKLTNQQKKTFKKQMSNNVKKASTAITKQFIQIRKFFVKTLFKSLGIVIRGIVPAATQMMRDINKALKSFIDSRGQIKWVALFEKMGIENAENYFKTEIKPLLNKTFEVTKTIFKTVGLALIDAFEGVANSNTTTKTLRNFLKNISYNSNERINQQNNPYKKSMTQGRFMLAGLSSDTEEVQQRYNNINKQLIDSMYKMQQIISKNQITVDEQNSTATEYYNLKKEYERLKKETTNNSETRSASNQYNDSQYPELRIVITNDKGEELVSDRIQMLASSIQQKTKQISLSLT